MPKNESEKVTVVAELVVMSPSSRHVVKSFDKAWHLMLDLAQKEKPVSSKFLGFVRKD